MVSCVGKHSHFFCLLTDTLCDIQCLGNVLVSFPRWLVFKKLVSDLLGMFLRYDVVFGRELTNQLLGLLATGAFQLQSLVTCFLLFAFTPLPSC